MLLVVKERSLCEDYFEHPKLMIKKITQFYVKKGFIMDLCGNNDADQTVQIYSKCSKILNRSFLLKRPRQTRQSQIRLKKQSDQGLPCLPFGQAFVNSSS